jgi:stress response protein YsnF
VARHRSFSAARVKRQRVVFEGAQMSNPEKMNFKTPKIEIKPDEVIVQLHAEEISISKEKLETGRVQVARRAISDHNLIKDIDWSDRTIEVRETKEQAVVSKSARIAEEVVIQKKGSDRVETVKDTVRRQQAEVERVNPDEKKKP